MIRMNQEKWRFNAGVQLQPQHSIYQQDYLGVHVDTVRNSFDWSPTIDFRYKFSPQSNLRLFYRGTATQPTMSQLLDITDNTDPQNVSVGNPGLRPAFTHRIHLFYNGYRQRYTQSWMTFFHFASVHNAIGNSVTYDASSGARVVRPVNINGNWNLNAGVMFNTSIDTLGVWNVNTFTTVDVNRYASLLQQSRQSLVERNITNQTNLSERLTLSYRNSWLEVALDGSVEYNHTKNQLQSAQNLNTWRFAYGGSINGALGHEPLHGPPHEQPPRLQRRLAQQQRTALERPGGAELPAWQAAHDLAPALRYPPPAEQPLARGQRHGPHGHGV